MTRWIRAPDWGDGTAERLHRALRNAFHRLADMENVWRAIGMDASTVVWCGTAATVWPALTRDAAQVDRLEKLILEVKQRKPALAAELDAVLAAEIQGLDWYVAPNRFKARLFGPGCRLALLDRHGLRSGLVGLAQQNFPVLAITGQPGTGKSYSGTVVQHAMPDSVVLLDIADEWPDQANPDPVDAKAFIRRLAHRLDMPADFEADEHTEATRKARELASLFVGRFRSLPKRTRWILIDGLDRSHVQRDVHALVGHLAKEVTAGQLGATRLIVTGHPGDFAPSVLDVLITEEIGPITATQLQLFFQDVADHVGRDLPPDELSGLVARVTTTTDLSDLRTLGRAVSEVAHQHFGMAGLP
jgi:hypothetical protein